MNPDELEADAAALDAAGSAAEEALGLHRQALAILGDGWRGQSGCAATDLLRHQCGEAADLVAALHGSAGELRALRDTLVDARTGIGPIGDGRGPFRLADRPGPQFAVSSPGLSPVPSVPPAPQAAAAAPCPPAGAWPSIPSLPPLPGLGGALGGLVAGIAQAVGTMADSVPLDAPPETRTDQPPPNRMEPAPPPAAARVGGPNRFVAQPLSPPPAALPLPTPAPVPDLPLLAAEVPPPPTGVAEAQPEPQPAPEVAAPPAAPAAPDPAPDPRTPCEIAADELPQVGQ